MRDEPSQTVDATGRSFQVLEALVDLEGAGVTELASYLDVPKSTTHNHLQTLLQNEYIVRNGDTYDVGLRFLRLGEYSRARHRVVAIAEPEVESLAAETGELVNLNVEEYGWGIFLYRAKGSDAVHMDTYAGKRVYLHTTAFGKAILANLSPERVSEIIDQRGLEPVTERTITDRETLHAELETIREHGVAFERQERLEGLCCVAAPILVDGDVVGAISVSGPESRMSGSWFTEELPDLIRRTTNVIEVNLRYGSK